MTLAVTDVKVPPRDLAATDPEMPARARGGLRVRSYGRTDPGRVRGGNEDQFLIACLAKALQARQCSIPQPEVQYSSPQGHLFLVADGVGGHAAGEKASAIAVNTVESYVLDTLRWCASLRSDGGNTLLADFQRALTEADAALFQEVRERPELRGMGTTLTLAYQLHRDLFIAHVGDSRCYLLRSGLLHRLTRDHTLVEELVQSGALRPEEAAVHQLRHVITNVVGGSDKGVRVEMRKVSLEDGDVLLLCSDGLSEMVPDAEILNILTAEPEPKRACDWLVDRANQNGGKDNITVVVARFEEG
jgi:protein phosphatase